MLKNQLPGTTCLISELHVYAMSWRQKQIYTHIRLYKRGMEGDNFDCFSCFGFVDLEQYQRSNPWNIITHHFTRKLL